MFSCAFDIFLPARQLPTLSPLSGLATTEALRQFLEPAVRNRLAMKWPNDVLWDQAKLSGILVEATRASAAPSSSDHHVVIIGIGLNLRDATTISQNTQRAIADWSSASTLVRTFTRAGSMAKLRWGWSWSLNSLVL